MSGKIISLPLFIPTKNFRNEAAHYQAIQLVDGFSICFFNRPSTLALRTSSSKGEIEVFVGGSVVEVAEGVWG